MNIGKTPLVMINMEGKSNVAVIGVVCLIIGILVGVGIGYAVFHSSNDNNSTEETYWYYIDYGTYQSSTATDGWISAQSGNAFDGLNQALANNGMTDNSISNTGWITKINGVAPDSSQPESWYTWVFTGTTGNSVVGTWIDPSAVLGQSVGTVFYIGLSTFSADWITTYMDPNKPPTNWASGGPFA